MHSKLIRSGVMIYAMLVFTLAVAQSLALFGVARSGEATFRAAPAPPVPFKPLRVLIRRALWLWLIAGSAAVLSGCKIELTVPEGGQVRSASGAYVCTEGQRCQIEVDDLKFDETFYAVPNSGYEFQGWRKKHRSFCGGKSESCRLFTSGFAGTDLEAFLSRPEEVFYLEPVFSKTTRQTVDGRYTLDTTAMRLTCSDGSQNTAPTSHAMFYVVTTAGRITLAPVISLMTPGLTPLYESVFSGPLSPTGRFTAEKNIKAYSSALDTVVDLSYQLEGQVSGGGWNGSYSVALLASAYGVRCDGRTQFSGIKHLPGNHQSPEGIWLGDVYLDGFYEQVVALVTADGEIRMAGTDGQQLLGSMTVNNDKFKASLLTYAPLGYVFTDTGLPFAAGNASGTILQGSTLYGSSQFNADRAQFNLSAVSEYSRASSLAAISGNYVGNTRGVDTFSITSRGAISGRSGDGCTYIGQVSLINPGKNLYRINVDIGRCADLNGNYSGLAALADDGLRRNAMLIVMISGTEYVISDVLDRR